MGTTSQTDTPLGGDARAIIAHQFGKWTAFSSLRQIPSPSSELVYEALNRVDFAELVSRTSITQDEFDVWHQNAVDTMRPEDPDENVMNVGRCAKAIAIYLKTVCYLAKYGGDDLRAVIHPPFDRNLMDSLGLEGAVYLDDYSDYENRVAEARRIADEKGCSPIELEQFWKP